MSTLRTGDRVRVEFEGVVGWVPSTGDNCWDIEVRLPNGVTTYVRHEHVTVLAPPEPDYDANAVYIDADGDVFRRVYVDADVLRWRDTIDGRLKPEDYPTRPLRKLVPEA